MAERKGNDGKLLERLVTIIQQALKDVADTQIVSNVKLPYKLSKHTGQIDVLIRIKANGLDYQTAIECKDHSRAISAEKVDAFSSKCNRLIGIDKKVIVSSHGFQKGALEAAYELGVSLYNLQDVSVDAVSGWINPEVIRQLRIEWIELVEYQAIVDEQKIIQQHYLHPHSAVFLSNGEQVPLTLLIMQTEREHRTYNAHQLADKMLEDGLLNQVGRTFPIKIHSFLGPSSNLTFSMKTDKGIIYQIERIEFGLIYHCQLFQPYNIQVRQYKDSLQTQQADAKADVLTLQLDDQSLNLIRVSNTENIRYFVTDVDGTTEELKELLAPSHSK